MAFSFLFFFAGWLLKYCFQHQCTHDISHKRKTTLYGFFFRSLSLVRRKRVSLSNGKMNFLEIIFFMRNLFSLEKIIFQGIPLCLGLRKQKKTSLFSKYSLTYIHIYILYLEEEYMRYMAYTISMVGGGGYCFDLSLFFLFFYSYCIFLLQTIKCRKPFFIFTPSLSLFLPLYSTSFLCWQNKVKNLSISSSYFILKNSSQKAKEKSQNKDKNGNIVTRFKTYFKYIRSAKYLFFFRKM